MLWPVSERPDSGRFGCYGRVGGVQSLDALAGDESTWYCWEGAGHRQRAITRLKLPVTLRILYFSALVNFILSACRHLLALGLNSS